jgi:hypothetical protein
MQNREEVVLERWDVEDAAEEQQAQRLVGWLHNDRSNALAVDDSVVGDADGHNVWFERLEPMALCAHMACSAGICNPVGISVRSWQSCKAQRGAGSALDDGGGVVRAGASLHAWIEERWRVLAGGIDPLNPSRLRGVG